MPDAVTVQTEPLRSAGLVPHTFPEHPGEVVSNSGTDFSGHLVAVDEATGETIGSLSGAFVSGIGDVAGHVTSGGACSGLLSRC